ncbi:hypothetical protein [Mesorhizobium sp.]|uniref:hypothetical protein n=1 Tax=Mesorhizobium sp. TaxID=1871066 RepID=UPI000FEA74A0|nr:hypothetical protein [Mesorhizobium sp.]RWO56342.1 MAG: hypothetical protein EOS14_28495 [Mesorhizobium sp.]
MAVIGAFANHQRCTMSAKARLPISLLLEEMAIAGKQAPTAHHRFALLVPVGIGAGRQVD